MKKDRTIIISGLKRSGKDTVANMLADRIPRSERLAFATPMKYILADTLGISMDELEDLKNDESNPHRGYLQRFGQVAKKFFGENCWGEIVERRIANLPKGTTSIISDFRMPVEAIPNALTINIIRPGVDNKDTHVSETALKDFSFDVIIVNDGNLEDLEVKVNKLIDKLYNTAWL